MNAYPEAPQGQAPAKPSRPVTGERAFQDTDATKHRKIVEYVNSRKEAYFKAPEYQAYMTRVGNAKLLVNQDTRKLETRFKMRFGIMRAGYDNLVDSLDDLFDVDDLVICRAEGSDSEQFAQDWQAYANKLLRSIHYHEHLSERFLYIPDYGWSIAHDSYQFSDGWVVKAQAKPMIPGFEGYDFSMQEDVYLDKPLAEIVRPENWFGSIDHGRNQPFQGTLKRWYLRDVYSAMERKDKAGNPLYNLEELQKLANLMQRGHQDADQFFKLKEEMGGAARDVEVNKSDSEKGPYVDIVRFHGPLNEITDSDLAKDPNEYYVECTRTCLLRWQENPRDRFTTYTHAKSHPYRNNPFSRSHLDSMMPHQQFNDFLACMSSESIVDNLTRHWAVWEEDMLDPNDFYSPKGLNAVLIRQGQGRLPEAIGQERNGAFQDIKDIMTIFDRDRQRSGATDQEMGVQGGTQDKTATAARILASATSKKTRAMVKRMTRQAIIPQIKNLVMLSLVHGKPENLQFVAGGRKVKMGPEHLQWWMRAFNTDTQLLINDTITRDRNEEAMKATTFFQYATQMAGQLPPDTMAYILRYSAELSGIPQTVIDKAVPEPLPVEIKTGTGDTVRLPSAMAVPMAAATPGAPTPMQGENENASMAPPVLG